MGQVIIFTLFAGILLTSDLNAKLLSKIPSIDGLDAIYGIDDREFVSKSSDKKIRKISKSIALIIPTDYLSTVTSKSSMSSPNISLKEKKSNYFFNTIKYLDVIFIKYIKIPRVQINASNLQESRNMCEGERFITSSALPACTGFLVAPNIMASAGHCFQSDDDCANKKIIFDVDYNKQNAQGYSVSSNNIFSCSRIISASHDSSDPSSEDYSLIELDRVPKFRSPLKLNLTKKIADKEKVFMIGHPAGMALMLSPEGSVSMNSNEFQFSTNLDSFEGNSGSPVLNAKTFEVEGILVNGQEDLVLDSELQCYRNAVYDGSGNEGVFRSIKLAPFLN